MDAASHRRGLRPDGLRNTRRVLTSRSKRMRHTAAQLSGLNSARSSRFAKSVASTIATSDGPPDPAEPVRAVHSRPSVRLLAAPPPNASHRSVVARRTCRPPLLSRVSWRSLARREAIGRRQLRGMRFWRRTAGRVGRTCVTPRQAATCQPSWNGVEISYSRFPMTPGACGQAGGPSGRRHHEDSQGPGRHRRRQADRRGIADRLRPRSRFIWKKYERAASSRGSART